MRFIVTVTLLLPTVREVICQQGQCFDENLGLLRHMIHHYCYQPFAKLSLCRANVLMKI